MMLILILGMISNNKECCEVRAYRLQQVLVKSNVQFFGKLNRFFVWITLNRIANRNALVVYVWMSVCGR